MRVLVVSNLFPPHVIGGYELGCRDIVEGLRSRGHNVRVLTSSYGVGRPRSDGYVDRRLLLDLAPQGRRTLGDRLGTLRREGVNRTVVARACREHRPDVVYVWNLRFLTPSLARVARRLRFPVSYFVSDNWLADTAGAGWPLGTRGLDLRHVQFASEYLKRSALEAGHPVEGAEVIHWGVDGDRFAFAPNRPEQGRLLYVGRLVAEKGLSTALDALRIVLDERPAPAATLTVGGGAPDDQVRAQVGRLGLEHHVRFAGLVPPEEMPGLYGSHDILVFPAVWEEPFSITLLEAMASGTAVVTTLTGGTAEVAEAGVNCLAFPPHDPAACAAAIRRLIRDRGLHRRLSTEARMRIETEFLLGKMIERVERSLETATAQRRRVAPSA